MRIFETFAAIVCLASSVPAYAEGPATLDATGISIPRSDTLGRKTYAWSTWAVGNDDMHVVVTEGDLPELPARYQGVDNRGTVRWTVDHACPTFDDYTTMFEVGGRIVCKWNKQIIAVDLKTGKEAWRYSDPSPMYITAGAQNRVAVSINNQTLAVLDAKDGRELMRIDVAGAVLEAVAPSPNGPLAMLVWDTPGVEKDTLELAVGEGGALEKVELSGDDPNRKLVALPIGGPAVKGLVPMKPRWAAPFGGYSFEVTPTAGAIVGVPRDGVQAAWDLADGKLLWERPFREGETIFFGEDGAAFARADAAGNFTFGAMDPKTLAVRWEKPLAPGERPVNGGQGGGDLGLVTSTSFKLVRYADGKPRVDMPLDPSLELANARSTKTSMLWVTQRDTERWLHFKVLPPL